MGGRRWPCIVLFWCSFLNENLCLNTTPGPQNVPLYLSCPPWWGWGHLSSPQGGGFLCWVRGSTCLFHVPLTAQTKSDLCRNLIFFIKLQITQGQLHLCFYHSVKLRILNVEDGQGMPAKWAFLASCNANTCCNRQEKVIVKFSLIFHSRII